MKLFLCSSYITPELKPSFEKLIGKSTKGLKALFVTTASNLHSDKSWLAEDRECLTDVLGCHVEDLDIEQVTGKELFDKFQGIDILWMNGGYTGYLMKKVKESGLQEYLPELLNRGIIYVGSSAGSMICSQSLEIADWYIGEEEPGALAIEGLGYISFQIYPHYEDSLLHQIRQNKPQNEYYCLLRNGQAISYNDGVLEFYGKDIMFLDKQNFSSN